MLPIVPTVDGPMSALTYLTFWALIAGISMGATTLIWWVRQDRKELRKGVQREVERIAERIDKHDEYIDDTNTIINQIHVDLAVQKSSMKDLKLDITEIKEDVKTLLKR